MTNTDDGTGAKVVLPGCNGNVVSPVLWEVELVYVVVPWLLGWQLRTKGRWTDRVDLYFLSGSGLYGGFQVVGSATTYEGAMDDKSRKCGTGKQCSINNQLRRR